MTLGEAREVIADAVKRVQSEGFLVWGFDDESIVISEGHRSTRTTYVDPRQPDRRPRAPSQAPAWLREPRT